MGRKQNSWLIHVKKTLRENRDKSFKQVLKLAKKTYKRSASAAYESKGVRKSRRHHHKTRRGGSSGNGSSSSSSSSNGELSESQSGGNSGEGGNPLLDMVKGAGAASASQKGGSGVGGGSSGKAEFGANAAPVA
jgi:hypothetical protein